RPRQCPEEICETLSACRHKPCQTVPIHPFRRLSNLLSVTAWLAPGLKLYGLCNSSDHLDWYRDGANYGQSLVQTTLPVLFEEKKPDFGPRCALRGCFPAIGWSIALQSTKIRIVP
ncbi:MAG: hypothetical protein KDJ67_17945, partial [Nitratireductor sp.]|nr:hypothetical protein [Nitratireductor sp.]